jgi:cell division topological specificity factor
MRMFSFLRPVSSAPVARERLQILLEYERNVVGNNDLFGTLRDEILAVVARYVAIDPDKVRVKVERGPVASTLAVGVEIPNKTRPRASARM